MKKTIDIINDMCSGLVLLVVETVGLLWLYCGDLVPRSLRLRLSLLLLVFGTLGLSGQEIFKGGERQPFDSQPLSQSVPALKAPGIGPGTPGIPPPTDQNMVGGVPVREVFWLWPLLAVGYGVYKKRVCKKNADDADNANFRG